MKTENLARLGGYIGATIGILGWLIGFSIVCLVNGMTGILGEVFWPGLLISLLMAAVCILVLENVIQRYGATHYMFQMSLWAMLLSGMGLMIFVLNHWLGPMIDRHPELAEMLTRMGSVYRVGDLWPTILMAVGLLLFMVVILITLKGPVKDNSTPPVDSSV